MEQFKPVAREKQVFQYQDETITRTFLEISGDQYSDDRNKTNIVFQIKFSSTSVGFSIETLTE